MAGLQKLFMGWDTRNKQYFLCSHLLWDTAFPLRPETMRWDLFLTAATDHLHMEADLNSLMAILMGTSFNHWFIQPCLWWIHDCVKSLENWKITSGLRGMFLYRCYIAKTIVNYCFVLFFNKYCLISCYICSKYNVVFIDV